MKKIFDVYLDQFNEKGESVNKKELSAAITFDHEEGNVLEIQTGDMEQIAIPLGVLKKEIENFESEK